MLQTKTMGYLKNIYTKVTKITKEINRPKNQKKIEIIYYTQEKHNKLRNLIKPKIPYKTASNHKITIPITQKIKPPPPKKYPTYKTNIHAITHTTKQPTNHITTNTIQSSNPTKSQNTTTHPPTYHKNSIKHKIKKPKTKVPKIELGLPASPIMKKNKHQIKRKKKKKRKKKENHKNAKTQHSP